MFSQSNFIPKASSAGDTDYIRKRLQAKHRIKGGREKITSLEKPHDCSFEKNLFVLQICFFEYLWVILCLEKKNMTSDDVLANKKPILWLVYLCGVKESIEEPQNTIHAIFFGPTQYFWLYAWFRFRLCILVLFLCYCAASHNFGWNVENVLRFMQYLIFPAMFLILPSQ